MSERAQRFKSPAANFVILDGPRKGERVDGGELTGGQQEIVSQKPQEDNAKPENQKAKE